MGKHERAGGPVAPSATRLLDLLVTLWRAGPRPGGQVEKAVIRLKLLATSFFLVASAAVAYDPHSTPNLLAAAVSLLLVVRFWWRLLRGWTGRWLYRRRLARWLRQHPGEAAPGVLGSTDGSTSAGNPASVDWLAVIPLRLFAFCGTGFAHEIVVLGRRTPSHGSVVVWSGGLALASASLFCWRILSRGRRP